MESSNNNNQQPALRNMASDLAQQLGITLYDPTKIDPCKDLHLSDQETSKIETLVGAMDKFPGSTVGVLYGLWLFQRAGVRCFINSKLRNYIRLPYLPDNGKFIILEADGSSIKRISNSDLIRMGFELSPARADSFDAIWDSVTNDQYSELTPAPDVYLDWFEDDGSMAVYYENGVKWTVLGGRDQLQSNFYRFYKLLPEIAYKMQPIAVLRITSGVQWTPSDATKLICSFSGESNLPRTVEVVPSRVNNEEDHIIPGGKVGKILFTAGKNIEDSTLFGITTGLAAMPVDGPNKVFFEYPKFVFVVLSYVLMFGSWMLKSTTGRNALTKKRLNSLSYCTAGGAAICAIAGVLCILFTSLSLPYALCGISICFLFVLLCVAYNAYSI